MFLVPVFCFLDVPLLGGFEYAQNKVQITTNVNTESEQDETGHVIGTEPENVPRCNSETSHLKRLL